MFISYQEFASSNVGNTVKELVQYIQEFFVHNHLGM